MSRRLPRTALMLDTELGDRRLGRRARREVLVVGELIPLLRRELVARGALLHEVTSLHDGFFALAARAFDVVVVNPDCERHGLDFVNAVKEGEVEHHLTIATIYGARGEATFLKDVRPPPQAVLAEARARHRLTPFVVLPVRGETEYAIIVSPPHVSFVEQAKDLPLAVAILGVDVGRLLAKSPPLA